MGRFALLGALGLLCLSVTCLAMHPSARMRRATQKTLNPIWNSTKTDQLKRDLLLNYDKFTRPLLSENESTVVSFDPSVNHVELDETSSILSIHCWIKMVWTDDKLKWNPEQYGGIAILHLADHEIWQPDIVPYNSAAGSAIDNYGNTHAIVNSDGKVIWVPPAILKVFCDLDLTKWPYDTQICSLKVGSWTYSGMEISLKYTSDKPEFANLLENAEWKFVEMNRERNVVHYDCCSEPYIDLVFKMTIQRRSPTYGALIVTPITVIVLMTLATFWLPAASTDKLTLGGCTALLISIFLIYFTQKLSVMAGHTPLIVSFYASSLYMVAFSLVISVIVLNLATQPRSSQLPWIIKYHLQGWAGRVLLLNTQPQKSRFKGDDTADNRPVFSEEGNDLPEGQQSSSSSIEGDWKLFATALDRLAFLFYCLLFSFYALAYLT